ncbi:GNAT family N-acetyltransferase [Xanthomonas sp. WHRI 10064A]|uniref:GNAT family N-acetyltransferase n=1 Tax=unclassified Xanthomonas TaxID=2643310 RepID=UPI002B222C90|nr:MULTISPECIES: GNAT family N-acetyltransferase [unclassified Xanthomonas]MEA9587660.1 GNAT family N-acetyltransferase [Xanthomonas sp. WHRI 10064B]MEA9615382.1 GNAT family N-acetyltransferase [Xanthomonas sp. WHRI 10064A]
MKITIRGSAGGNDCLFAHKLLLSEVRSGHFEPGLLDPRAQAGLMANLESIHLKGSRQDSNGKVFPAQMTIAEINGSPVGFIVTSVLEIDTARVNEIWLAAVSPEHRKNGVMTELLRFFCSHLDAQGKKIFARLLPASNEMRRLLSAHGFQHIETLENGYALLERKARTQSN